MSRSEADVGTEGYAQADGPEKDFGASAGIEGKASVPAGDGVDGTGEAGGPAGGGGIEVDEPHFGGGEQAESARAGLKLGTKQSGQREGAYADELRGNAVRERGGEVA